MATTTDAPAGPWRIEGNEIRCAVGENTRVVFIGNGCPELIIATEGLPPHIERHIRGWSWARSTLRRPGPLRSVKFPREHLGQVCRLLRAETL